MNQITQQMKPTCIHCDEQCDTEKEIINHIHIKHGNHACQNTWMQKNNVTCHSRRIMPIDPTLEFTPCTNESKNSVGASWVFRGTFETHCLRCWHDDKIGNQCDCHHCRGGF